MMDELEEILKKYGAIEDVPKTIYEKKVFKVNGLVIKVFEKVILAQGKKNTRSCNIISDLTKIEALSLDDKNAERLLKIIPWYDSIKQNIDKVKKSLEDYKKLVDKCEEEPIYQDFLFKNPQILNLDVETIYQKYGLAGELIPDYVLILYDKRHIFIEIEKPSKKIFTKEGIETSEFREAFDQILNFHRWIGDNLDFLRNTQSRKIPLSDINSSNFTCILVIGHNKDLSSPNISKLQVLNAAYRGQYEIITFDELYNKRIQNLKNLGLI